MKTLLVLAQHPELRETLRAGLKPEHYRIVHRTTLEEAEPLLTHGLAQACLIDVEQTTVQEIWVLEKLRRRAPRVPIIVYTAARQWDWEEEAYLQGATHVLTRPVRIKMLSALLDRLWAASPAAAPVPAPAPMAAPEMFRSAPPTAAAASPVSNLQSLSALRGFSAILTHSLDAEAMLKQFLLHLRELIGVNRAAIFLRQPASWLNQELALDDSRPLRSACAIGLPPGLLEHFELSFNAGIGGQISKLGRIL